MIGCFALANIDRINVYFSESNIAQYEKYDVRKIDDTDVKFINLFFPKVVVDVSNVNGNTNNNKKSQSKTNMGTQLIQVTRDTAPIPRVKVDPTTGSVLTASSVDTSGGVKNAGSVNKPAEGSPDKQNNYDPEKAMNMFRGTIPDELLISNYSSNRTFGDELPWDREIGHCEVMKGSDKDLYKSVQDTNVLTFF